VIITDTIGLIKFLNVASSTVSSGLTLVWVAGLWNEIELGSKFLNEIRVTTITTLVVGVTVDGMLDRKFDIFFLVNFQSS